MSAAPTWDRKSLEFHPGNVTHLATTALPLVQPAVPRWCCRPFSRHCCGLQVRVRWSWKGGTHNPAAPPFDFLSRCFVPVIELMGDRGSSFRSSGGPAFSPAGGGNFLARVQPVEHLRAIELLKRGNIRKGAGRGQSFRSCRPKSRNVNCPWLDGHWNGSRPSALSNQSPTHRVLETHCYWSWRQKM